MEQHSTELKQDGFTVLKAFIPPAEVPQLTQWVNEVGSDKTAWHHFETVSCDVDADTSKTALARSEDFVHRHDHLGSLILKQIPGVLEKIVGEKVALYKEKINWKAPGGAGWVPHQDAPAYPEVPWNITVAIAVDPMTPKTGGLSFSEGAVHKQQSFYEINSDGVISQEGADKLIWRDVPMNAGDILVFDSFAPHMSGTNLSPFPRRVIYITYNLLRHGELREAYYANKRAAIKDGSAKGTLSHIASWAGKPSKL
eukprot:m.62195 g.62195  ORF g.62195 m.62195 type:complete len:255 (-) comp23104_c0_seq2:154-918(-)